MKRSGVKKKEKKQSHIGTFYFFLTCQDAIIVKTVLPAAANALCSFLIVSIRECLHTTYMHTYIHTYIHSYIHTYIQTNRQTDIHLPHVPYVHTT